MKDGSRGDGLLSRWELLWTLYSSCFVTSSSEGEQRAFGGVSGRCLFN